MKDKILTKLKFEDFIEYKHHQNEKGMNTEFTEYQIGYKLIKVIDGIKDVFEEGLLPALLSIVNKDNNEKRERLANPHELGIATEPFENMSGIDKVTVNGKEFFAKCKQGSIRERLDVMDEKIKTIRSEEQGYNYYSDIGDLMVELGNKVKRKTTKCSPEIMESIDSDLILKDGYLCNMLFSDGKWKLAKLFKCTVEEASNLLYLKE